MTTMESLAAHYRVVRDRLYRKPPKLEWNAPSIAEIPPPRDSLHHLAHFVALKHDLTPSALMSVRTRGNKQISLARRELYYLAYQTMTRYSVPQMGRVFKRDHTTILKVAKKFAADNNLPIAHRSARTYPKRCCRPLSSSPRAATVG
jgi:Bacterial dnaA protein helix-turn-helix